MNQTLDLPLDALAPDEGYQPRERLDLDHLERLRCSDVADWPPLLVSPVSDEAPGYFIIDGFHRYQVAKERQLQTIRCTILPDAGYEEAFAANLKHGLPLSTKDRKEYAKWLRENHPEMGIREIAAKIGVSASTASRLLDRSFQVKQDSADEAERASAEQEVEETSAAASCASELAACRAENQRLRMENQLHSIIVRAKGQEPSHDETNS